MVTQQEMEEFRQDMLEEDFKCQTHECLIRSDYDYFAKYYEDEFEAAIDAIKILKELHNEYGHTLLGEDLI